MSLLSLSKPTFLPHLHLAVSVVALVLHHQKQRHAVASRPRYTKALSAHLPCTVGNTGAALKQPLKLNLASLPHDDGVPSESMIKRQKLAEFEQQCSKVNSGLEVHGGSMHVSSCLLCAVHSSKSTCLGSCYLLCILHCTHLPIMTVPMSCAC